MKGMRNKNAPHIDFGDLLGAIEENPRFLPSNVDMLYERKGWFLCGEWKRNGEKLSTGQEILLRRLSQTPKFSVLIITGDTDDGMKISKIQKITKQGLLKTVGSSVEDLKNLVRSWYAFVESKY